MTDALGIRQGGPFLRQIVDQAALQGMLQKFYTLGLVLVKVQRKMKGE